MALRIIEHHFGDKPRRIVHQSAGQSNFVFVVWHKQGEFVVRLSPDPARLNAYIKEQWAMERAGKVGVPTPQVLEVGNQVVPHPYMVSRKVRGKNALDCADRMQIVREMGRLAGLINSISTSGFGNTFDWSKNQLSRNETWKEFLHIELKLDARLELLEKQQLLSAARIKEVRQVLEAVNGANPKPALCHGDMRLKNLMVLDNGSVSAVLDWEHCMSNLRPHWELSLALHDLNIDEKQEFLAGYGIRPKAFAEAAGVIKALNILNYAPKIERRVKSGDGAALEQLRLRLGGMLDLYSP